MWYTLGRKTTSETRTVSLDDLSVHRVSSGNKKYYRLCFPRGLGSGASKVRFAVDDNRKVVAVVADYVNVLGSSHRDSFHVSIDRRVGKKYVTFKAGEVPGIKPGKYFASIPWHCKEGPVRANERVLFYLHPSK